MKGSLALSTFVLAVAGHGFSEDPSGPNRFAIQGARLHLGTGEVVTGGIIVVDDGLITAVGVDVPVPEDAWVIEGSEKHVYPGFINAFCDLGLTKAEPGGGDGGREQEPDLASGPEDRPATTPWRAAADELTLEDERIESWRNAGFTSSVTAPRGGIFPGQAAFLNLGGGRDRDMVVSSPAALVVDLTPPGGGRSFPGSLMGVLAYVEQSFLDATHYLESAKAYESSPRGKKRPSYDRALAPLSRAQTERWPVLFPANERHEIERAIALAQDSSVRPVLYGVHEGYAAAEVLRGADVPVLVSLKWPKKDEKADPDADEPLRVLRLRDRAPATPAALEHAGVRFAFYTEDIARPEEAMAGIRRAIEAGLSAEAAVAALTLEAATIFDLADRTGSLEAGKIANLFIADGDAFEEGTKVESVFVDGKKYDVPPKVDEDKKEEKTP